MIGQARGVALELEEGAQAGEERRDGFELAAVAEDVGWEGRGVAKDERAVGLALRDDFSGLAVGLVLRGR